MTVESIDKLRRMSHMFDSWHEEHLDGELYIEIRHYTNGQRDFDSIGDRIREILDEAESELIQCYYPLPVDADGVLIHPGDTLYVLDGGYRIEETPLFLADNGCWAISGRRPDELTHVKPRTIEDVLREFVNHVVTFKGSRDGIPVVGIDDDLWRDYYAETADELRDLMGVKQ